MKNEEVYKEIGVRLRKARKAAGLSVMQVSDLMLIPRCEIDSYEIGHQANHLERFAELYAVDLKWLVGEVIDIPDEWLELTKNMPPDDREKLLELLTMIGGNNS